MDTRYCRGCDKYLARFRGGPTCPTCRHKQTVKKTNEKHKAGRLKARKAQAQLDDQWRECYTSVQLLTKRLRAMKPSAPDWFEEAWPKVEEIRDCIRAMKDENNVDNHTHWRYAVPLSLRLEVFKVSMNCPVASPFTRVD